MNLADGFWFIGLPYLAIVIFLVGTFQRYHSPGLKVSSLSSQFLEGRTLFFGSVPFHWGILAIFVGHLTVFLFPQITILWNSNPVRLIALEVLAFVFGLSVLIGLTTLFLRRLSNPRIRVVTSKMDIVIELLIWTQIVLGCWIALGYRWGSSWFAADLSPYLWSLVTLEPKIDAVAAMPLVIRAHIVGAFVILALIPFSRLIHFMVAPFHYIWRSYQKVVWYWDRRRVTNPRSVWTEHYPKNN